VQINVLLAKTNQNACEVTETVHNPHKPCKSMISGKINQNACKPTQIAFKLAQTTQIDVFRQINQNKCKLMFPAKEIKMRAN
jgi:hypothetical protein